MLLINCDPIPNEVDDLLETILTNDHIKFATQKFLSSPRTVIPRTDRSLCIFQGESALVSLSDSNVPADYVIGSEDATTCMIVVVIDHTTQTAWTAHYDEDLADHDETFLDILPRLKDPSLYLLGAFKEPTGMSLRICRSLLKFFHSKVMVPLQLKLSCVYTANTHSKTGLPACHNLAVDCATGEAHPACFEDRGPALPRRFACRHCLDPRSNASLLPIFDTARQQILLLGFETTLPWWLVMRLKQKMSQDDATFLKTSSTSPECERDSFVADVKGSYSWLLEAKDLGSIGPARFAWDEKCGWFEVLIGQPALSAV